MSKESVDREAKQLMFGMAGFLFGAAVTIFAKTMIMGNQLTGANAGVDWPFTCWWLFFIACNIAFLIRGMGKGWAKGDPANGLVAATGPIVFYAWTFMLVWRKYIRKEEISL